MIFRTIDSIGMRLDGLWLLLGRLGLGALFAWSGYGKLMDPTNLTRLLTSKGWPAPMAMAYAAGAVEVIGGVLLVIGLKARSAAFALIVFTIIATLLAHAFWIDPTQKIQFFKNLAIIGGLLFVFGRGAGSFSADRS